LTELLKDQEGKINRLYLIFPIEANYPISRLGERKGQFMEIFIGPNVKGAPITGRNAKRRTQKFLKDRETGFKS